MRHSSCVRKLETSSSWCWWSFRYQSSRAVFFHMINFHQHWWLHGSDMLSPWFWDMPWCQNIQKKPLGYIKHCMSHEEKRLCPIQPQYLGWIMGIPEWSYPLDLPPNRGYRSPPRFSAVLSFRNPNLNLYLLASWEGGMKWQSIIYNPLKHNQVTIPTASNNQYQAIIYNTKLSSRSSILVVATMPLQYMPL